MNNKKSLTLHQQITIILVIQTKHSNMKEKQLSPTITVLAVAWSQQTGRVLKYQAQTRLGTLRICGDPAKTRAEALDNLIEECHTFSAMANNTNQQLRDTAYYRLLAELPMEN